MTDRCHRDGCNEPLDQRRRDARFCSDRCRLIAWEDRKVDAAVDEITEALRPIVERLGRRARREEA